MRIWVDTANLDEIAEWAEHPWVSGFTTNPTLMDPDSDAWIWAAAAVAAADGKPISIDGPQEVYDLGNVYRKRIMEFGGTLYGRDNLTAVCHQSQLRDLVIEDEDAVISVFAGRIMDTGRDPQPVIDAARTTGAQVLWASVREPYNIVQAEAAGCDIVTVPPAILRKYLDWHGKPLETVAQETIAQFDKDREGLW